MTLIDTEDLRSTLHSAFNFDEFRTGQLEVISKIMADESVLAIFPTGAGKSLCYQLPATLLPGITLVVSPLLSLMYDQLDFLKKHSVPAACLDSTLSRQEYQNVLEQAQNGSLKVLMISVERFRNERFRTILQTLNISLMVVDEAHCISEWGHNFRPEYLKIPLYQKEFSIKNVLLLTATATKKVAQDICEKFQIKQKNLIRTGFYRSNLHINALSVSEHERVSLLVNHLKNTPEHQPAIVYVTLQKTAETVAAELNSAGIQASAYHAGMTDENRVDVQSRFMDGTIPCVVATIAFGMGIDKRNIRSIIHFDLPKSIEGYSQEIGRGGRDNLPTQCLLFANTGSISTLQNFVYGDTPEKESITKLLHQLAGCGKIWEVKIVSLSNDTNIRQLPLKTALVYLEMEGIITPHYSYFSEYQFKTDLTGAQILSNFSGEPAVFLKKLLKYTIPKKTWITVDLGTFLSDTGFERKRAIAALEYLHTHDFIELEAKQGVDVYHVNRTDINIPELAEKMHSVFVAKERAELNRISEMIRFFESKECLSYKLAGYFDEILGNSRCGHCSVCTSGPITMCTGSNRKELSSFDIKTLCIQIDSKYKVNLNSIQKTRFLCGITSPQFTALKVTKDPNFGLLEKYDYAEVLEAVQK